MNHNHQSHADRRKRLLEHMASQSGGGIAIVPTAPELSRNRDSMYPFRPDSYLYYLSGFSEPEAVVVLVSGRSPDEASKQILFCREKNPEREIWDGFRYGPAAAPEIFAFDEAFPFDELHARLADLMSDQPALYTPLGLFRDWDRQMTTLLNEVRSRARAGVSAPETLIDVRTALDEMRLVKDEKELQLMRRAGQISSEAHRLAMARVKPGWWEYQAEAELMHCFLGSGALAVAYPSIVASGPNACVLHYRDNNRKMQDGDLLLIDAGCEYQCYASDITRTFPVNGKFSGAQRDVYELVLAAQDACISSVAPGRSFQEYHSVAEKILAQGLVDLKLCSGSVDGVLESGSYKQFYMHRAGHWLGLDVHDAGQYTQRGVSRKLEPGMVLTVEPGLYIRPAENVPVSFWDIGIRIEDDIVVTAAGNENLTAAPKAVADIEAVMRN